MARHFTKQEIEELRSVLVLDSVKDSEFPSAERLKDEDLVAIVQDGVNKTVTASQFIGEAQIGMMFPVFYVDDDMNLYVSGETGTTDNFKFQEADGGLYYNYGIDD